MSLLEELKEQRAEAAEHVADLDLEIKASAAALAQDQKEHAEWVQKLADLDRAIAALSVPEVAEVEIPEGFTKWEGGDCPVAPGTLVKVIHRDGDVLYSVAGDDYAADWTHCDGSGDIIAYRVLPIEPAEYEDPTAVAIAAYIEAEQADYPDLTDEQDAAIESATAEYQSTDGAEIVSGEPWSISASEQHAEESARAQDLAPLFPPEPPQPATPESLRAGGIVDSEASWWARKLTKVEA